MKPNIGRPFRLCRSICGEAMLHRAASKFVCGYAAASDDFLLNFSRIICYILLRMLDAPIPYEIMFERRPQYLYARITADSIDRDMALRYLRELADKCAEFHANRVMLERNVPAMLCDVDNYLIVQEIGRIFGPMRCAVINPHVFNDDTVAFGALVGENRNLPWRSFATVEEAEAWLLSKHLA